MKATLDLWKNSRSYILPEEDCQPKYNGKILIHGAELRFSLNIQKSGAYLYRGTMSAMCPDKDEVITVSLPRAEDGQEVSLKASKSINTNEKMLDGIKAFLADRAFGLYAQFSTAINRSLHKSVRKETILPDTAFCLYGQEFIDFAFPNASDESRRKYYSRIEKHYMRFPERPMAEYSGSDMKKYLIEKNVCAGTIEELRKFWLYCLDRGICLGSDPFPEKHKRKPTADALINKAVRPDELSEETQDKVYEQCMNTCDAAACATALILWGGLSLDEALKMKWKHIIFDKDDHDLATILLLKSDYAGATHIFNHPLFVQGARILRNRYSLLCESHGGAQLANKLILCHGSSDDKALSRNALIKSISTLLRSCGVLNKTFAELKSPGKAVSIRLLTNTYRANLIRKCGLEKDIFTVKYLCGESMRGNTSCDSYISFSDDDAIFRQYSLIKITKPTVDYDNRYEETVLPDGATRYQIFPQNSKHCAGVTARMLLPPGGEIRIKDCLHGVDGDITVRAVGPDGKPKRKSRKKKDISIESD